MSLKVRRFLKKFWIFSEKKHFRKICLIEMQIRQPRWKCLDKKLMNFIVRVPKALRKAFFFQLFSPPTWESALNLPPRIFLSKGTENFSLCVRQGFKLVWKFEKFSRLFPCGSLYSSRVWNCLNGQTVFNSDTPAERLWLKSWKKSPTPTFFPHSPKDFPSCSKVIKRKSIFWKKFSKFSFG